MDKLKCCDCEVPLFSLNGSSHICKVVYIYDGDTVNIVIDFNNKLTKFNCRLLGIDTCEMTSKDATKKQKAVQARNFLINKITNEPLKDTLTKKEIKDMLSKSRKLCYVKCHDFDKYGRLLIDLYDNDKSLISYNQELINNNLAVSYDGGHKDS